MKATFEKRPSPRPRDVAEKTGIPKDVEYVCISTGRDGADAVHRLATDTDRLAFRAEYLAFNPAAANLPPFRSTSREPHEAEPSSGPEAPAPAVTPAPLEDVEATPKRGFFTRKK